MGFILSQQVENASNGVIRPLGRNKDSNPFGYPVARTEGTSFGVAGLFIFTKKDRYV